MKIPINRIAWFLMVPEDPCQGELLKETLRNLCRNLDVSAAMVHLLDDTVVLNAKLKLSREADLGVTLAPRTSDSIGCAIHGAPVVATGACRDCLCPCGRRVTVEGFCSYACVPLRLGGTPIGALSALSESPREFSAADVEHMVRTQLALGLHHLFYFPELTGELLELEQAHGGRGAEGREGYESLVCRMQLTPDSVAYQVLTLLGCSHVSSTKSLVHSMPKGIHWPTLHRACEFLDHVQAPISRRELSGSIGVSDVTAGHYLKYLADLGLVWKEMAYGKVGRPTAMYRPVKMPASGDPGKSG